MSRARYKVPVWCGVQLGVGCEVGSSQHSLRIKQGEVRVGVTSSLGASGLWVPLLL